MTPRTVLAALVLSLGALGPVSAQEVLTRDQLAATDFTEGRDAFLARCGACHTLIDGGGDLMGPNLWQMFDREVGTKDGFKYSDVLVNADFEWTPDALREWLIDPDSMLQDSNMIIGAVPEEEIAPLIAYVMVKTGAADWQPPEELAMSQDDLGDTRPLKERHPSFWNHLMKDTAHYIVPLKDGGTYTFVAYFNEDGSISSNFDSMRGFWREERRAGEQARMCYALFGIPVEPFEWVECFPIVGGSVPRYGEGLWISEPYPGLKVPGGFLSGRPHPTAGDAHPGYWDNLYQNTMRYEIEGADGEVHVVDAYFNEDKTISSNTAMSGKWYITGEEDSGEGEMCYTFSNVPGVDGDLSQCFALELMFDPRIGARWPSTFEDGTAYWAEVVEGRG